MLFKAVVVLMIAFTEESHTELNLLKVCKPVLPLMFVYPLVWYAQFVIN